MTDPAPSPPGYRRLDPAGLVAALADVPAVAERLGPPAAAWSATPLDGGNLNSLHAVRGPRGAVCAKQSLPYMRILGESAPMPLDRIVFERAGLEAHFRFAPDRIARPLHFDPDLCLMVSELLEPHVPLRAALMAGRRFPRLAGHLGDYLADVAFLTSDLALPAAERRRRAAACAGNSGMYRFMEDLAFTEPYMDHPRNAWNRPHLDATAAALRADGPLKAAVCRLKHGYLTAMEAHVHGDLHTDSILVTETDTRVIDLELSGYGPMGYDLGHLVGHLLFAHFARDGYDEAAAARAARQDWLLDTICAVWRHFRARFAALWRGARTGDAWPTALLDDGPAADAARDALLDRILAHGLGFAGVEMIRRIVNVGQVADLQSIADPAIRAAIEMRCITLARELILGAERGLGLEAVCTRAMALRGPPASAAVP
ncbi:MAG: S-methyl-5-thioribose kinase [Alphaproteobacteria bacterium]